MSYVDSMTTTDSMPSPCLTVSSSARQDCAVRNPDDPDKATQLQKKSRTIFKAHPVELIETATPLMFRS